MNPGGAGDLIITVGGDLTALEAALDQIPQLAQDSLSGIQSAVSSIDWSDATTGADAAAVAISGVGDATATTDAALAAASDTAATAQASVDDLSSSMEGTGEAAETAATAVAEVPPTLAAVSEGAEAAESSLSELGETMVGLGEGIAGFEVLKDLGVDAYTAAGGIQQATVALQSLGMSGEQASQTIENLEALAVQDALSMPDLLLAQQRMTALQIPAAQIATLITDAAGAADTMNVSFSRVVQQIDNMIAAGTVSVSTLSRMGISAQSFVAAINQVAGDGTADVNDLTQAFAGLSQTQAIEVVEIAMKNMGAAVAAQAATIPGQIQIIKTSWDLLLEDVGKNIAPATGVVLGELEQMLAGFMALPAPIKEVTEDIIAIGVAGLAAAAAIGGLTLAIGSTFGAATIGAITTVGTAVSGFFTDIVATIAGVEGAAAAVAGMTVAVGALAVGIGALIGYKLAPTVSDWVTSLLGFGTAAEAAAKNAGAAADGNQEYATSATAATGPTTTYSAVLKDLGVSMADLPQKTKDAVVALQTYAQAAAAVAQSAQNVTTTNTNTANSFALTAEEYGKGTVGIGQYTTALNSWQTAQTAANNGLESANVALLVAVNDYQLLVNSATNAATTFGAVSNAFANGQATASQYTAALNAMNKAQMDANNGFELASTAALVAVDAYRTIATTATNAQTNVTALGAAAANGTASWTQYDAALQQLVKDEENQNNGLLSLHTAMLVQAEDLQNLGVTAANAETNLEAIVSVLGPAAAGTAAYTSALNALNAAQEAVNAGIQNGATALAMVENSYQQLQNSLANATTMLQATQQAYLNNKASLEQLTAAMNAFAAASENASQQGMLSWQAAQVAVTAAQNTANAALTNANTLLGQAQAQYAAGAITLGVYNKYVQAQAQALAAVTGVQQTATASATSLTASQSGLTAAFGTTTKAAQTATAATQGYVLSADAAATANSAFVSSAQLVNGQFVQLGGDAGAAAQAIDTTGGSFNIINGQMVTFGANTQMASAATQGLGSSLSYVNGQFVTLTTSSASAAAGVADVGTAATKAAAAVQTLGDQLDTLMGDIAGVSLGSSLDQTMNAAIGGLNMSLTPGEQYSQPAPGSYISGTGDGGNVQDPSELTGLGVGGVPAGDIGNTQTYDPQAVTASLEQAAAAAAAALTTTATAATTTTTANTALAAAMQQATDANALQNAAAQASGTAAYAGLEAVADAAQEAAAAALASAEGLTAATDATTAATTAITTLATTTATATSEAGLSSAALNALNGSSTAATSALTTLSGGAASTTAMNAVLASSAADASTALTGLAATTATTTGVLASAAASITAVSQQHNMTTALGQAYTSSPSGIGYGSGVGGTGANAPEIGDSMASTVGVSPGIGSITINISNGGTVVGQNGMQQFSQLVGNNIVQTLNRMGIRNNRQ